MLDRLAALVDAEYERGPIYTLFSNGRPISPTIDACERSVSWLNSVPGSERARRWLLPLFHAGVWQLSRRLARDHARRPYDLVISTSSSAIHTIRAPEGVPHICYCFTPPRYLWHLSDQYSSGLMGLGLKVCSPLLRRLDARGAARVSVYLADSNHTGEQIGRFYRRLWTTVFPPVRTQAFTPVPAPGEAPLDAADLATLRSLPPRFYLYAGALEPYKRGDLAVEVAAMLSEPVVIAGGGSQLERLRTQAAGRPGVTLLGRVSDALLRELYRRAIALLFPQLEDFGIIPLEAQACGLPIVAYGKGGALDTVRDGVTGVFFAEQTAAAMAAAVPRCPTRPACEHACRQNAERFSEAVFTDAMRGHIERALRRGESQQTKDASHGDV